MSGTADLNETSGFLARMEDGGQVAVQRWGPPRPERIVISHGNGLAIDGFFEFGKALMTEFEVIAFDMRNHGNSPTRPISEGNWERFLKDFPQLLSAIDNAFGKKPSHGAFHSLSSVCALLSNALQPYPWQSLTLFEPPMTPPDSSELRAPFIEYHAELSSRASRRRAHFESPTQLMESLRRAPAFARVPDQTVSRLARATLHADPDGGEPAWRLSCPPAFEAETYDIAVIGDFWPEISNITTPVRIVVGDRKGHNAPILVDAGRHLADSFGFNWRSVAETNHFMQLEQPEHCARLTREFAQLAMGEAAADG